IGKEFQRMGYYTDKSTNQKRKKPGRWLLPIGIGIVVGALLMFIIYPTFSREGSVHNEDVAQNSDDSGGVTENAQLNVNVSTQITNIVDEVSDAVVGVTNIQNRSDYWMQEEGGEAGTGSGVIYKKDNEF